jgi:phosphate transport system substrate-binding protein
VIIPPIARRLLPWLGLLAITGCPQRQEISTTRGKAVIGCDEAILPAFQLLVSDFRRSYQEAEIDLRPGGARAVIVDFINDSIRVITSARPLNQEERGALEAAKVEYREYHVALDAVAVILNSQNPVQKLRITELDSILSGETLRWRSQGRGQMISVALCGLNSGTNEIVRTTIMDNKPFSPTASYHDSSKDVLETVRTNPNAIGIVGVSWLRDMDEQLTVVSLGDPNSVPDSTQPPGVFYSPAQANVYRGYYPLSTKVYMYNREIVPTVGLGFIAYASSVPGQKVFQESGLVPATMPVRLVETTSKQVK